MREAVIKTISAYEIIGRRIEGVYEISLGNVGKFENYLILVKLAELGTISLELTDINDIPELCIYEGEVGQPVSNIDISSLIGCEIIDVVASEFLASVTLLLSDNRMLTNDVLEFENRASIFSQSYFKSSNEYISLTSI